MAESFRLYRVIVPVPDIERAVQVYGTLLGRSGQRVSPGRHYFNLGGVVLALYDPPADGDSGLDWAFHENQYLYIAVSNLDAVFQRAQTLDLQQVDGAIEKMPWGERLFYARDPFGTPICFVDETTVFTG